MRKAVMVLVLLLILSACGLRTAPEGMEISQDFSADDYLYPTF